MGVVYKARDTRLERFVAIKVLPPERVADPERQRRFVQEAKAASALNHPNIVHIYNIDRDSGVDFIAMEYVAGKTLYDLIGRKGLKTAEALHYAMQIADALAAAHRAGIVHRDIKPSNIIVSDHGLVKVLDFGLAKLTETAANDPNAPTQTMQPQTEEGTIIGTAAYMSPEQAEGKRLDARSDIFSFGAVLYEMVTGQRAFQGSSRMATLSAVLHHEPAPISEISSDPVPPELQTLVTRCLRKDPQRRIQHLDDVKLALEELKQESASGRQTQSQITRAPKGRRWMRVVLPAALLAALVAAVLAWRTWHTSETAEPLHAVPLTSSPGVHRYPSFSPEGTHVAFTWNGQKQDNIDIYVQQIGSSGSPLRITTDPASDFNPVWSPDGRWIAFLRGEAAKSELRLIPPLGGTERKIADIHVRSAAVSAVTPPFLTWCPGSTCMVVTNSAGEGKPDALFVFSLEGDKRQLTFPQPPTLGDTHPAISPDGNWLVFRHTVALFGNELHKLRLRRNLVPAGEPQRLTPASLDGSYPTWTPDSKTILFSNMNGSLSKVAVDGESKPVRLPFAGEEDGIMPAVSQPQPARPPRLVYARNLTDMRIWRVDTSAPGVPASSPPVLSTVSSTRHDWMPQLSPDGRRVAFGSDRAGWDEAEIWAADLDGSNAIKLTSLHRAPGTGYPHWSPDGKWIVFHSDKDIYLVPSTGGKTRNLTNHPALDGFPSFSRDGKWIYFNSNRTGEDRIWKMPSSGGDPLPVTNFVAYAPLESPDRTWLYYTDAVFTQGALWRIPVAGGAPEKIVNGVMLVNYAVLLGGIYYIDRPAGEGGVYFVDKPSSAARLQYFDFATRRSTTIVRDLGNVDTPLTATPDGRTILFPRTTFSIDDLMLVENFR
jgi:eukaryotic-like serine/threonine-protein kinase